MGGLTKAGVAPTEPKTLAAETPEQRELRRLRQQVAYVERQRDILSLNRSTGFLHERLQSRLWRVCTLAA